MYRDAAGRLVSTPPPGKTRNAWPVQRALLERRTIERTYRVQSSVSKTDKCFRVRAWPLPNQRENQVLIAEETEEIGIAPNHEEKLKQLDTQLTDLVSLVTDFVVKEVDEDVFHCRVENPNLQPCRQIKQCGQTTCPAYDNKSNLRCWEIPETLCPENTHQQNPLEKSCVCSECEVFMMACPDPLTRVAENFNRLLHLLQILYQRALEAQQQIQITEKIAVIGELALGIAHEIKNPLSIIMGRLDCLSLELESLPKDELMKDLEVIRNHAARVQSILENLLNFTRPDPPVRQPVQINHVILATLPLVHKVLERAKVRLETHLGTDLPTFNADPIQIQQVLLNLYLNARDAMPEGGELVIASRLSNENDKEIIVEVTDTGNGMTKDQLEKIFSPFYSTKVKTGGTGLGLAVCSKMMQQHGGRIEAESTPGAGTTFRLRFLIQQEQ